MIYEDYNHFININRDMFDKHQLEVTQLKDNDIILKFRNLETNHGHMEFIYVDGILTIQGDYGYAIFNWYNKNNHISVYPTFKNIGYILSKLKAGHEETKGWDYDKFYRDYKYWIETLKEEGYDLEKLNIDENPPSHIEDIHDVISHFKDISDRIDSIHEYGIFSFGEYITDRPYIWWYGLTKAVEALEIQKGDDFEESTY